MLTIPNISTDEMKKLCEWDACLDGLAYLHDSTDIDLASMLAQPLTDPHAPGYFMWFLCLMAGKPGWLTKIQIAELCYDVAEELVESKAVTIYKDIFIQCGAYVEYSRLRLGGHCGRSQEMEDEQAEPPPMIHTYSGESLTWLEMVLNRMFIALKNLMLPDVKMVLMPAAMIDAAVIAWEHPDVTAITSPHRLMSVNNDAYLPSAEAILAIVLKHVEVSDATP